jgi:alkylation response protein AidB-like acyl-CoA dehydrogenase
VTARLAELPALVTEARAAGAAVASSDLRTRVACGLLLDALETANHFDVDALLAPVATSRDPFDESLVASASGRSWVLTGAVTHVPHAVGASTFLAVVRSRPFAGRERGLRVYALDASTPGLQVQPRTTIDDDNAARVVLNSVQVGDERAVGPSRDATAAVEAALDALTLVVVAEMLGAADAARRHVAARVQQRVQFGEPLSRKQAVAHRVADMTMACDAVGLLLDDALASAGAGGGRPDPLAVATAKLVANTRLPEVTAAAHQLHGGEGYYADQPLHRWHRRVSSLALQYGDRRALRNRSADLLGLPLPR